MGILVNSPVGRVIWCDLTKPDNYGNYSIKVAFDEDADLSEIEEAINKVAVEKFGKIPKKAILPIVDGNTETDDDDVVYPSSKDMRIIRFKDKACPPCIGPAGGNDIIEADEIYSGCYVIVKGDFFAYDNKNKGVSVSCAAIQFVRKGERIGGAEPIVAEEAFDAIPDNEKGADDPAWL